MKQYKIIYKSMMDNSKFQHTETHKTDKEAIDKNKGLYRLQIWKRIK